MKYLMLVIFLIGCGTIPIQNTLNFELGKTYKVETIPEIISGIAYRKVTQEDIDKFKGIHKRVKRNFTYKTDLEKHGVADHWGLQDYRKSFTGDCDDFALAIKDKLALEKIPARFIIGKNMKGWHIGVLVGNYVSENNGSHAVPVGMTKHKTRWKAVSGFETTQYWYKIVGAE